MTETERLIAESAARLFAQTCDRALSDAAEQGTWPASLWAAVEAAGFAAADEVGAAATVVRVAARHAAPLPLAETWLARAMLAAADLPTPEGPLTVGPVLPDQLPRLRNVGGEWRLSGTVDRLPWGGDARPVLLAADGDVVRTALLPPVAPASREWNLAHEPRDRLILDGVPVAVGLGWTPADLLLSGALMRTVAMTGAMESILELTLRYAGERVQFGRPIAKFQAVQQQLAVLAAHVAAAGAALAGALAAARAGPAAFPIAAAKLRAGEAAAMVAEVAHQVHGAIGFTREYPLNRFTRRLWSWRDEFGSEAEWAIRIGRLVSGLGGGEALWPFLTDPRVREL